MSEPMKLVDKINYLREKMKFYTQCIKKQQNIIADYESNMKNAQSKEAKDRINRVQIGPEKETLSIYNNNQNELYRELRIVEYLALEQQEKESDASRIVGPPVKIKNSLFAKGIGKLSRFGNEQGWIAGRKEEILKYLINYELEKKKNELREKVRNDTREYWGTTRISQEEFEKSFKRNYKLEEGKWVREEVNLKEIREAVLKEINIYGSTNILSNTWERPKADQIAKLTPANPENTATYDNVKRAQPIGREGAQPPKQSTTIETR